MGFKEDADFARFVSMGAIGSAAVASHLRNQFEHQPIELERYAMANKVWQTKVKRLRLPDLLCVRCGLRIESRAKSKLSVVLSHSDVEGREWDAGGMRDQDLYAFLKVQNTDDSQHISEPSYFSTESLRSAIHQTKRSSPKASSEGSEVTLRWPCWVPNKNGTFVEVNNDGIIVCKWTDGRIHRYWQWRSWKEPRFIYLQTGAPIIAGETIVAGVVRPLSLNPCSGDTWDLVQALNGYDEVDRHAAIKAAGLSIGHLPKEIIFTLSGWLSESDDRHAVVAARLLQRHHQVDALLDACGGDKSARLRALRALGDMSPQLVRDTGGDKLTPAVAELLEPMWQGQDDWLRTTGREGLEALDAQKVRYDPANPVL